MILVAFDFDGTLTRGDSLLPFLRRLRGAHLGWDLLRAAPQLTGFALGRVGNDVAKERLLRFSLGALPMQRWEVEARAFADETLPRLLRPEMVKRLQWHQAQGHACVLVSASPAIYLRPWSEAMGFAACLATELQLGGRLLGANCHGEEKLRRLDAWKGGHCAVDYAYGDTRGDLPLLRRARFGHWVGGGRAPAAPEQPHPLPP